MGGFCPHSMYGWHLSSHTPSRPFPLHPKARVRAENAHPGGPLFNGAAACPSSFERDGETYSQAWVTALRIPVWSTGSTIGSLTDQKPVVLFSFDTSAIGPGGHHSTACSFKPPRTCTSFLSGERYARGCSLITEVIRFGVMVPDGEEESS